MWTGTLTSRTSFSKEAAVAGNHPHIIKRPTECFLWLLFFSSLLTLPLHAQENGEREGNVTFSLPAIPSDVHGSRERALFLSMNYWNGLEVKAVPEKADSLVFETAFADFLTILPFLDREKEADVALETAKTLRQKGLLDYFIDLSMAYLLGDESYARNETQYGLLMEPILSSAYATGLDGLTLERARFHLEAVTRNRVGSHAEDFAMTGRDGEKSSLKRQLGRETILMFFNFDCRDCRNLIQRLSSDRTLEARIQEGAVQVIAVYKDAELETWQQDKGLVPESWKLFYEQGGIDEGHLYDLPSLPAMYLLSAEGTVILSKASLKDIQDHLLSR